MLYVNINNAFTQSGTANGSENDPFDYAWLDLNAMIPGDDLSLKGIRTGADLITFARNVTSWGSDPWRLELSGVFDTIHPTVGLVIERGILFTNSLNLENKISLTFNFMFIKTNNSFPVIDTTLIDFNYCTIIDSGTHDIMNTPCTFNFNYCVYHHGFPVSPAYTSYTPGSSFWNMNNCSRSVVPTQLLDVGLVDLGTFDYIDPEETEAAVASLSISDPDLSNFNLLLKISGSTPNLRSRGVAYKVSNSDYGWASRVYVNINDGSGPDPAYVANGQGNQGSPLNWTQAGLSWIEGFSEIYMKGYLILPSSKSIRDFTAVKAWDLDTKGPWRINCQNNTLESEVPMEDGIVFGRKDIYIKAVRCYIEHGVDFPAPAQFETFDYEDCTLIHRGSDWVVDSTVCGFNNCIMAVTDSANPFSAINGATVTLAGECLSNASDLSGLFTNSGSTVNEGDTVYGWIVPILPIWTEADLTKFNLSDGKGVGSSDSWAPAPPSPVWSSTYPKTGTVGANSVEVLGQTNVDSTMYFVVLPDGASEPTSQQVKDGEDATGTSVASGFSGNVSLTGGIEGNAFSANQDGETAYDIYVVAESTELQDDPILVEVTTSDVTDPINAEGYPKVEDIQQRNADAVAKINENGTCYYIVQQKGDSAGIPTPAQVKAGQKGNSEDAVVAGDFPLTANTEGSELFNSLVAGGNYEVYMVCEDASSNLQDEASLVEFVSTQPSSTRGSDGQKIFYVVIDGEYENLFTLLQNRVLSQQEAQSLLRETGYKGPIRYVPGQESVVQHNKNFGHNIWT